jgi:hypothetical protein
MCLLHWSAESNNVLGFALYAVQPSWLIERRPYAFVQEHSRGQNPRRISGPSQAFPRGWAVVSGSQRRASSPTRGQVGNELATNPSMKKARYRFDSGLSKLGAVFGGGASRIRTADLWIMIPSL